MHEVTGNLWDKYLRALMVFYYFRGICKQRWMARALVAVHSPFADIIEKRSVSSFINLYINFWKHILQKSKLLRNNTDYFLGCAEV